MRMSRSDRHNEVELNLLEQGRLVYLIGGGTVVVPAGRLAIFWAGVPHQVIDFEGVDDYLVCTVPLAWFLQWRLPEPLTQPVLHGEVLLEPDERLLDADVARFREWMADLQSGAEARRQTTLLELEARLRRLAHRLGDAPRAVASVPALEQPQLSRAEEMAAYLAQHCTRAITAEEVGRQVGLHPNYAMTIFRRAFGTTLTRYVTQHRLSHAQRLLVTSPEPIAEIAFRSGFGSLSRFNEAFRQSCGCTPREYRQRHAQA